MKTQTLYELTKQLLAYVEESSVRFEEIKSSKIEADFYSEVKPFADKVKELNDRWKNEAILWLIETAPKNLHRNQIETTSDHIEIISIQAFFPQTSRKRFIDQFQSVKYVLENILVHLDMKK
ncbi:DUF1798 domain-containing protein [Bacillus canaveralius]|uniref:DUF1798 domain-containing protein n=1 Tax=Bacillus canaveralius TaxID=1403243 RepID=A0A2N5GHX9_9BACI|nr:MULTISPECIES: YppE family protein [Bacillus]PLR80448.1 DUF1798 domain-containing protein [Bacillus canaveralius]PLR82687.1 DUF1798 domain-containing protein [Bacillus sp. V33-4]PLS00687.1 DUF1798 domain-containing protein [Bacillus canaveralius]RSK51899.1 DUF1798 family protein [Bacillus canaveralius]